MISVRAEGLGKAYRVYKRPFDSLKELLLRREYSETFWALHDVTLEVAKGSSLGIVGDNGAGKSTLLKLLAGAIAPTSGHVERVGRVAAILNLGAGFHPDLPGTENIRIGCAVLGLSPAETEVLLPQIVAFSELGSFVDRPVRTYSSGMHLRLGFSVATAVSPDVLVVDEHLSVGDQHFRFKCLRRIMALRSAGCTLVFCSHDLHAVGEVCDRTLWLRDGHPAMLAATQPVLKAYEDHVRACNVESSGTVGHDQPAPSERQPPADNCLREVLLDGDCRAGHLDTGGTLKLRVVARLTPEAHRDGVHVVVLIIRNDAVWCYGAATTTDGIEGLYALGGDEYGVTFVIDDVPLLSGQYSFTVALMDDRSPHTYDFRAGVAEFTVRHGNKEVGVMRIPHRWECP
jgi:lipopolysaccharide transport system ATP-binding protein